MKFSIVSTFYNNTIEEVQLLKESIINQTYTNWEWIISDDFSKDCTVHIEYLKSLPNEDKRIRYVEQKTKKEIFWNPQTYATGNIVILIGGDDTILPKTLETYGNHFLKYPEVIMVTSESNIYNPNLVHSSFLNYKNYTNIFDKRNLFPIGWLNMGVPLAWRNIPINFTSEFNLNGREIINDYLIHTKLEEMGRFVHIPRVFYNYKIRPDSVSRKIDNENSFNENSVFNFNSVIENRRGVRKIDGCLDIYNDIIKESHALYYTKLNHEKTSQFVSYITTNELSINKQQRIKEVWSDHNIYFNVVTNKIDYFIFYLDDKSNFESFIEKYNQINNPKEILIFIRNNGDLYQKITESIGNYSWFSVDDFICIIKTSK